MNYKQIPFTVENAKKIQNGEIKGKIETREGNPARIICFDRISGEYPLVALERREDETEEVYNSFTKKGRYYARGSKDNRDLLLYIEDNTPHQFKAFDRVLVRDEEDKKWRAEFFSHIDTDEEYPYECTGDVFRYCIPYEGNEHLLGTTNSPE